MTWIKYLLEANLYLALFYALYYLLLRRETHYQLNRFYLLGSILLSFATPLLQLGFLRPAPIVIENISSSIVPDVAVNHQQVVTTTYTVVSPVMNIAAANIPAEPINYYLIAYFTVALIMTGALILRIYQLTKLARKGKRSTADQVNLIELEDDEHAFSFFSYLFISKKLSSSSTIIQHELVHIQQKHSLDIMFIELVKIICWFNPVIYLLQNSIKELHEYIADSKIANVHQDVDYYTDFLISNAYGLPQMAITNNFFTKNLLKKRIMMLHQKRSGNATRLKYLVALPLLVGMLCASTLAFTKDYPVYDLLPKMPLIKKPIAAKALKPAKTLQAMVNEALTVTNPAMKDSTFITIRGLGTIDSLFGPTSPLYVIDGVVITKENAVKYNINNFGKGVSPLQSIRQEDILSMEILKDATATSIYGNKGKNGVILIITKNGKPKEALKNDGHPLVFIDGVPFEWKDSDLGFDDNGMAKSWTTLLPAQENIALMEGFKPEEGKKLYGDKGANGVMLITTIQGQAKKAADPLPIQTSYIIDPKTYTDKFFADISAAFTKQGYTFSHEETKDNDGLPLLKISLKGEGRGSSSATFRVKELKEKGYVINVGFTPERPYVRSQLSSDMSQAQPNAAVATQRRDTIEFDALKNFLHTLAMTVKYPPIAREKGVTGRVLVQFDFDGGHPAKVTNAKIVSGLSPEIDAEVLRAIGAFSTTDDIPVSSTLIMAVDFALASQSDGMITPIKPIKDVVVPTTDPITHKALMAIRGIIVRGYVRKL